MRTRDTLFCLHACPKAHHCHAVVSWPPKLTLPSKEFPGISGWVTIGGYSALDGANTPSISSSFVNFEDWKERGTALNQDVIVANMYRELAGIQEAQALVIIPPSIRGLGQAGGFQMMVEDRGNLGLKATLPGYHSTHTGGKFTAYAAKSGNDIQYDKPATLSEHRPDKGRVAARPNGKRFRGAPGLPRVVIYKSIQQVQSGIPGLYPG